MSDPELFEVHAGSGIVRGTFARPDDSPPAGGWPGVLICGGVHPADEDTHNLLDGLAGHLRAAGFGVARYDARCADLILDDFHAHTAAHDAEDAAAVLHWLSHRSEIDAKRIAVLGWSLGAIAASMVAKGPSEIWRLCLVSATTADDLAGRMTKRNGVPALINPDHLPAAYLPSLSGIDSTADAAAGSRPTLVLQGAADRLVPPEVSLQYVAALELAHRRVEHVMVARADHAFAAQESRDACCEQVRRFLTAAAAENS